MKHFVSVLMALLFLSFAACTGPKNDGKQTTTTDPDTGTSSGTINPLISPSPTPL